MAQVTDDSSGGDDLYALEPSEFVAARNAMVKQMRGDGQREAAKVVAALRRPNVTAAALNQVARRSPELVLAVVEAGELLRRATGHALSGDPSDLREATEAERRASNALVAAAVAELGFGGAQARPRIASTVHAAMVDDAVADELRRGVLTVDHDRSGLGLDLGAEAGRGGAAPAPAPARRLRVVPDPDPGPERDTAPDLEQAPPSVSVPARRKVAPPAKVGSRSDREHRRKRKLLRTEATKASERAVRLGRRASEAEAAALAARAEADDAAAAARLAAAALEAHQAAEK